MSEENDNIENEDENVYAFPEKVSEMTGYDHLYLMCKNVRNESSSARGFSNPITPRLRYIMNALAKHGLRYEFVPINSGWTSDVNEPVDSDNMKLANVMVEFKVDSTAPTVIFTAHHDIANPNSENCQDNTASVCNLIHLCTLLKKHQEAGTLLENVVVGFTDLEEAGGKGIDKLIAQIQNGEYGEVSALYALELTAGGTEMWIQGVTEDTIVAEKVDRTGYGEVSRVRTPYNESVNARRYGIPAVCIGILPKEEMDVVNGDGFGCSTWSLCHRLADTFEKSANKEEMTYFVNAMLKMVDIDEETFLALPTPEEVKEADKVEDEKKDKNSQVTIFDVIRQVGKDNKNNNNHSATPFRSSWHPNKED